MEVSTANIFTKNRFAVLAKIFDSQDPAPHSNNGTLSTSSPAENCQTALHEKPPPTQVFSRSKPGTNEVGVAILVHNSIPTKDTPQPNTHSEIISVDQDFPSYHNFLRLYPSLSKTETQ
ncbi:hypothetical protein KPH14_002624 [Odynerus spinipes]|uniref:Uncharacterized protein n=1 Tax=Odynerus spinipes TaxID=1348599 RepID=A0AAD9REN6_9HYME|nr:hypothetical protein KPH14_002624 [Odynerus spinipes]